MSKAASVSSQASKSASSLAKTASSSSSSLASAASKAAASSSSSLASAAASATAAAKKQAYAADGKSVSPYLTTIGVFTAIIGVLLALHFTGQLDPLYKKIAKQYFKAEAKAEMIALQQTGSKEAEGYLKDKLKDNPAADLADGELDDLAKGGSLGDKLGKVGGVGGKLGL